MACFDITKGVVYDCDNPIIGGIKDTIFVFNFDDIDRSSIVYDATNTKQITSFSLKSGGKAVYEFEQFNRSIDETWTERKSATYTGYAPVLSFSYFMEGYASYIDIQAFSKGRFCAITKGIDAAGNGDTPFRLFGLDIGLRSNGELGQSRTNPEFGGVPRIPLANVDEDLPETVPYYPIWDTDYNTTDAFIESLKTPTV